MSKETSGHSNKILPIIIKQNQLTLGFSRAIFKNTIKLQQTLCLPNPRGRSVIIQVKRQEKNICNL